MEKTNKNAQSISVADIYSLPVAVLRISAPAGLVGGEVFSFASSKYIITTVLLSVFFFSGEGQDNQSIIGILAREHEMTSAVLI